MDLSSDTIEEKLKKQQNIPKFLRNEPYELWNDYAII